MWLETNGPIGSSFLKLFLITVFEKIQRTRSCSLNFSVFSRTKKTLETNHVHRVLFVLVFFKTINSFYKL